MRLNLGCGSSTIDRPGWVNVDLAGSDGGGVVATEDMRGPIPFAYPGEVDEIVSSHSLEHVEDPVAVLSYWFSLLRPGGVLTVAVPDATHKHEWIGIHLATYEARDRSDLEDHHVDFTPASLEAALRRAGEWSAIEHIDPNMDWRLPGKVWWQACVRAVK